MDTKPENLTHSLSDKDVKAPNVFERVKEEFEAILHTDKSHHHHKETHGKRNDIDENTPVDDVKAPNVFERAKEEIEALVQTIHSQKDSKSNGIRDPSKKVESKSEKPASLPDEHNVDVKKAPNLIERAKEEFEALLHNEKSAHHHHKETHGMSDDIDENTPINEIKGPNVFERAKEEFEALVQTIHDKKETSRSVSSAKKKGGFSSSLGRGLDKICTPRGNKEING